VVVAHLEAAGQARVLVAVDPKAAHPEVVAQLAEVDQSEPVDGGHNNADVQTKPLPSPTDSELMKPSNTLRSPRSLTKTPSESSPYLV